MLPIEINGDQVFVCGQKTETARKILEQYLSKKDVGDVATSSPPFNNTKWKEDIEKKSNRNDWTSVAYTRVGHYNMPVYGLEIQELVSAIALELSIKVPWGIDRFVLTKIDKIERLLELEKKTEDSRLQTFVDMLKLVSSGDIVVENARQWSELVNKACRFKTTLWQQNLQHKLVLSLFDFDDETITHILGDPDLKRCTEWLSKALCCFKITKCVTDIVNFAAWIYDVNEKQDIANSVRVLKALAGSLGNPFFAHMVKPIKRVPTVLLHDNEFDDKIVEALARTFFPEVKVFVQVGREGVKNIDKDLPDTKNVTIFVDEDAEYRPMNM